MEGVVGQFVKVPQSKPGSIALRGISRVGVVWSVLSCGKQLQMCSFSRKQSLFGRVKRQTETETETET